MMDTLQAVEAMLASSSTPNFRIEGMVIVSPRTRSHRLEAYLRSKSCGGLLSRGQTLSNNVSGLYVDHHLVTAQKRQRPGRVVARDTRRRVCLELILQHPLLQKF